MCYDINLNFKLFICIVNNLLNCILDILDIIKSLILLLFWIGLYLLYNNSKDKYDFCLIWMFFLSIKKFLCFWSKIKYLI